jgi:hypothetical protein
MFTDDGRLQIYHSANANITLHYQGRVLSVEAKSVRTKTEFWVQSSDKTELVTDDSFMTDPRMKIGWGGVFYLELNHQ